MLSMEPVDTMTDGFEYLYRIHWEGDRFNAVTHRPNGDAFSIQRRRWPMPTSSWTMSSPLAGSAKASRPAR